MGAEELELAGKAIEAVGEEAYKDLAHPILQPTGQTLGLIPRAVKAALLPLEKWIVTRENNLAEIEKLLAEKLKDVPPETIVPPEPYVAVPALQAITYCMDSEELREMFANLLAESMREVTKDSVHPSFVEIIKQLCPEESKILLYFSRLPGGRAVSAPMTTHFCVPFYKSLSTCTATTLYDTRAYVDNLMRLGLVAVFAGNIAEPKCILKFFQGSELEWYHRWNEIVSENAIQLTSFGADFCRVCIK